MTKQYTPIYQLPYPQIGDPIKEGQANMEELAKKVETTLQNGSFPASNPDVASMTARLNTLESKTTFRHAEWTNGNGFAVSGGLVNWDMGTQFADNGQSINNNFSNVTGPPPSGAVNITQSGFYIVSCIVIPDGTPGRAGLILKNASNSYATDFTDGAVWELSASFNGYIAAGTYIRGVLVYTNSRVVYSRLRITKLA